MARGDRICTTCGKDYVYCPPCKKGDPKETWRYMFCGEECRTVFRTCADFAQGHINAEQAKKKLNPFDLTDKSRFSEDMRINLSAIYADFVEDENKEPAQTNEETVPEADTEEVPAPSAKPAEPKEINNSFKHYNNRHKDRFVNK